MQLSRLADALSDNNGNVATHIPKYLRLSEGIVHAIETGELRSGDRLPGESKLARALPASLGTIQKALGHLAERGVLVRRHGTGTFVAEQPNQLHDLWHFRFLDDDGVSLLPVYTRVSKVARVEIGGPWTAFLGEEDHHIRINREIDINHEFRVANRIFLPGERFDALADAAPGTLDNVNIRAVLRERFDAPICRIIEQVGAETIPEDICRLLRLPTASVGMAVHIRGYGFRDAPLSYQVIYMPPNTRRLEFKPRHP